jgi:hypothetical protein
LPLVRIRVPTPVLVRLPLLVGVALPIRLPPLMVTPELPFKFSVALPTTVGSLGVVEVGYSGVLPLLSPLQPGGTITRAVPELMEPLITLPEELSVPPKYPVEELPKLNEPEEIVVLPVTGKVDPEKMRSPLPALVTLEDRPGVEMAVTLVIVTPPT